MARSGAAIASLLLLSSWPAAACGGVDASDRGVLVFAAASLEGPFRALEAAFEAAHPQHDVRLHFAGTSRLVLQLREGAPAGVFASADEWNMQRVVAMGRVDGAASVFASNGLGVVVANGNPCGVASLADLQRSDLKVALCGPEVPAGRYARRALASAGVTVRSLSDEPSVAALVSKVALGELDAGIVYATDIEGAAGRVDGVRVARQNDVEAVYSIAVLRDGRGIESARAFVAFVQSDRGLQLLARFGFGPP